MPYPYFEEFVGRQVVEKYEKEYGPYDVVLIIHDKLENNELGYQDWWTVIKCTNGKFSYLGTPQRAFFEEDLIDLGPAAYRMTIDHSDGDQYKTVLSKDLIHNGQLISKGTEFIVLSFATDDRKMEVSFYGQSGNYSGTVFLDHNYIEYVIIP